MLSKRLPKSESMQPAPNQSVVRMVLANDHVLVRDRIIPSAVRVELSQA